MLNIIATCNPLSRLKLKKKGRREKKRRGGRKLVARPTNFEKIKMW